jgi:hypothetical protein
MGGRLRRREIIPEDTPIVATINEPKLVHGQYGRQLQAQVRVIKGDYRGTEFRTWFSFGKDKEDGEEYVPYGGPLHTVLSLGAPNLDEFLDSNESLNEKKYQAFVKKAANDLDGVKIMARVGVKANRNNPEKKSNILQPGSIGTYEDPDEALDAEMAKAPF